VKISCPTCAAKYSVADEKIQSRLAKIRCRKCSSTIVIDGTASPAKVYIGEGSSMVPGNPPNDAAAEPTPGGGRPGGTAAFSEQGPSAPDAVGPAPDEYAVDIADNDQRNMTIHQIVGAYNEGLVTAETYIWKEGMADWQTLADVREVADALHAAAARPAAAAVRRVDNGGSKDLFGGIDRAGAEDDIHTSAPEPPPTFTAGTGARNESSVLFSLSALTGSEPSSGSSGSKRSKATTDDSGLIDLHALTAGDPGGSSGYGAAQAGSYGASPLISAPLGGVSGPAVGAGLGAGYGQRSGNRATLIIAAIVLALGIVGGVRVFVSSKNGPEPEQTSALDKHAAADKAPAVAPEKPRTEPEPAAAPAHEEQHKEATGEAPRGSIAVAELPAAPEPQAKPVHPSTPRPRTPPRAKQAPASVASTEAAPAPKPAPIPAESAAPVEKKAAPKPAAASPCACSPADLMCAMRCSAKKK